MNTKNILLIAAFSLLIILNCTAKLRTFVYVIDGETGEYIDSAMVVARNLDTDRADTVYMVDWPKVANGYGSGFPIRQSLYFAEQGIYEFRAIHPSYLERCDTVLLNNDANDARFHFALKKNPEAYISKFTRITGCVRNGVSGESIDSVLVVTTGLDRPFLHRDHQIVWDKHGYLPMKIAPVFNSVVFEPGLYHVELSANGFKSLTDTIEVPAESVFKEYKMQPIGE